MTANYSYIDSVAKAIANADDTRGSLTADGLAHYRKLAQVAIKAIYDTPTGTCTVTDSNGDDIRFHYNEIATTINPAWCPR